MTVIKVNYGTLEAATGQIQSISATIGEKLDTLRAQLQRLEWVGHDRQAYQAAQEKWDRAIADLNQLLHEVGAAVGVAKENYQMTERSNQQMWG
jgi:ESAT-6 family protein